jgi:hypothetical protein
MFGAGCGNLVCRGELHHEAAGRLFFVRWPVEIRVRAEARAGRLDRHLRLFGGLVLDQVDREVDDILHEVALALVQGDVSLQDVDDLILAERVLGCLHGHLDSDPVERLTSRRMLAPAHVPVKGRGAAAATDESGLSDGTLHSMAAADPL